MRFPYHQIEEDPIEPVGNIQSNSSTTNPAITDEDIFSPPRPLLPQWPSWIGWSQIAFGFICAIFGSLQVFVVPGLISPEADLGLFRYNWYGAAIWLGFLLGLSGSCALRAAKLRDLNSVIQFYVTSGLSFLCSLGLLILIQWCYIEIKDPSKCNDVYPFQDCDFHKIHKYAVISLLSVVWCLLGCLLLFLSTINYFCPVMFGEVHLLKKLLVCWLPCCFYLPPQNVLLHVQAHQSSDDSSLNVIV